MPLTRGTFAPATATQAGGVGFVPSPAAGEQLRYLQGDGTFGGPLFNKLQVPSDRFIGPLVAYGGAGSTRAVGSFTVLFTPIYSNGSRSISQVVFQVTTASGATGSPTMELAMYNSGSSGFPTTRISDSLKTGIDPTTTGVKTLSYSPSFTIPAGISWCGIKVKTDGATNNNTRVRSMDGTGREAAFLASIGFGWPNNPTTNNYASSTPISGVGEATALASDYTSASFQYETFGAEYIAVFLKT
jgi:hypothetical protein